MIFKMSRQVDLKALVSHIVRGDGVDKCRICMGDTSEGQVYLGDTVLMDGDKPVTLAELLEVITGVEVPLDGDLPSGLCFVCSISAQAAGAFRLLCRQATEQWSTTLQLLERLPALGDVKQQKSIFVVLEHKQITIIDHLDDVDSPEHDAASEPFKTEFPRTKRGRKLKIVKKRCHCPDCDKKFDCAQDLQTHLMDSTDNKRACHVCASIMPRDELVPHLRQHDRDLYDCNKCPALFQSLKQLKVHVDKAHTPGAHSCGDCGRSFKSSYAFHGHLSVHAAKTCPGCDKLFRNHRCYLHHVKRCCNLDKNREDTYHTKNRVTFEVQNKNSEKRIRVGVRGSADEECICDYCGKKFAGKKFVCAHIQIVHLKNTHKPCPYCGKLLAAAHLTEHLKRHEEVPVFTCELCGIVLKSKLGYIQHKRLHTGEKPYACKFCSETFSASSRRSEHIRKAHKSSDQIVLKHVCEFCPARYRLPYRLKRHVATVHTDKKDARRQDFECPECHIKFGSCRGLIHHSRKHQTLDLRSLKKNVQLKVPSRLEKTSRIEK